MSGYLDGVETPRRAVHCMLRRCRPLKVTVPLAAMWGALEDLASQVGLRHVGFQAPTRCCRYGERFGISGTHVTSVRKSAPNDSLPVVVKPAMLQGPQFTHGSVADAIRTPVFSRCAQHRVL